MPTETREGRQAKIFGARCLARLQCSKVAVIGLGLLGGGIAYHLGLLPVSLLFVDCDTVDEANLGNQGLPADRVGAAKALVRADQVNALNPTMRASWLHERLENLGLGYFARFDLLVSALDSRIARLRLAEISQQLRIPWLDLACDGSGNRLHGVVTYRDPRVAEAPCGACHYDSDAVDQIRREGRGPGCPSWAMPDARVTAPTLMASGFGGVVSGHGATWAARSLLGQDEEIANSRLQIFGDGSARLSQVALTRSPHCVLGHEGLGKLVAVSGGTIGELFARAAKDLGGEPDGLYFHHRHFICDVFCPTEGRGWEFPRIAESIHPSELECGCHRGARLVPMGMTDHLTRKHVERFGALAWTECGLPRADVVTARKAKTAVHYVIGA